MQNKLTIYWTKGLPGSGKSTYAKALVAQNSCLLEVNRDELRKLNPKYNKNKLNWKVETEVLEERDRLLRTALETGNSVISSDTNLKDHAKKFFEKLGKEFGAEVVCIDFFSPDSPNYVSVETCFLRDLKREDSVGKDVILKMWYSSLKPAKDISKSSLPKAYIVDLDGTLFHHEGIRGAYEEKYDQDAIDLPMLETVKALHSVGITILLVSGREATAIAVKQTLKALEEHGVPYDKLHMRQMGDRRPDTIIKKEIYENLIQKHYNVIAAFDDRPKVSRQFESLGIKVFKCGPGYEF